MTLPYPSYRHSGVEWLGDVPEHWVVCSLKRVLAQNDSGVWGDDPDGDEGTIVLRSTEQTVDGGWSITDPAQRRLSPQEQRGALLAIDDLVVTKSSGSALHIGKTSLVTEQVAQLGPCFSNFMQRLRCFPDFEPRLAWYLINSHMGRQQLVFNSNTTTGLANLNATILGDLLFPMPPPAEQRSIAAFLDCETAQIDALIAKKQQLLDRLAEFRTALITRTVTKGLPPDAAKAAGLDPEPALKDSGVEWLDDVPEHWTAVRISAVACPGNKSFTDGDWVELPYITDSGVRLIQTGNIGIGEYREQGYRYIDESSFDELRCTEVDPGDVLICRLADPVGRACRAPDLGVRMITSVDVCILKPSEQCSSAYLTYLLSSKGYLSYVESLVRGGTRDRISRSMLGAIKIPNPPCDEQHAIAAFLDRQMEAIDALSTRVETAIERLQEYRTALITAAVTGKIDVRDLEQVRAGARV